MKAEIILIKPEKVIKASTISVDPFDKPELDALRKLHSPAFCLIAIQQFKQFFHEKPGFFYNCGRKHRDKELSKYNRKPDMIQLIDGSIYRRFGSLLSSIDIFLNNCAEVSPDLFIFLGVNESLMEDAGKKIVAPPKMVSGRQRKYKDSLLEMLDNVQYPADLDKLYVGSNEACIKIKKLIWKAAENDIPVLILGDTGTGKEVVAKTIHDYSSRGKSGNNMVTVNCGAIPDTLFESEMFGHEKGIFTDAKTTKIGKWEIANDTTLFLDEIGELSLHNQVKLLRVLDEGCIYRLGGTEPIKVNARVIAATNKDLITVIDYKKPLFRLDLYHRLAKFIIKTQPLSCHTDDIPEIASHLWTKICKDKKAFLSGEVLNRLRVQYWPGNVRELKHFLERIYIMFCEGKIKEEVEVRHIDSVIEDEIINYISPPNAKRDCHPDGEKKDGIDKEIQQIESLLKIARKSNNAEKQSVLLTKSQEWLNRIIEEHTQTN